MPAMDWDWFGALLFWSWCISGCAAAVAAVGLHATDAQAWAVIVIALLACFAVGTARKARFERRAQELLTYDWPELRDQSPRP